MLIRLRHLRKHYTVGVEHIRALDGVDLEIGKNEYVAIMGSSGSGKSTLMNILGCLDRPTTGTYHLGGREVGGLDADTRAEIRNRRIGFVFQSFNLLTRTTALENVELPLYYGPLPLAEQHARARAALTRAGIAHRADHLPSQMSGGEQQRVAIARALVGEPDLLLADEPTGNLDSKTSTEIMTMLRELNRSTGVTVVIVTHDPEVAAVTNRVITFRDGRVISDGPPQPASGHSGSTTAPSARGNGGGAA